MNDNASPRSPLLIGGLIALALVLLAAPFIASPIMVLRLTNVVAFTVAFAGLHVLTGRLGLVSIGHGAAIATGAVAAGRLVDQFNVPYLLVPIGAFFAAFVLGLILGIPSLRVPGTYLALITLSVAVAFPILMRRIDGPLGNSLKIDFLPPSWVPIAENDDHIWQYLVVLAYAAVAILLLARSLSGAFGRALLAVRDDAVAASACGINVRRTLLLGVAISSGFGGLAGGLVMLATPFVNFGQYPTSLSIEIFALAVVLGTSSLWGLLPGGVVLVALPVFLRERGLLSWEPVIYAVALLVVTRASKGRGLSDLLKSRREARLFSSAATTASPPAVPVLSAPSDEPMGNQGP